jgi:hypothetical protein
MNDNFSERRGEPRSRSLLGARAVFNNKFSTMDCLVRDIGRNGARLRFGAPPTVPQYFELRIDERDEKRRARRVWTNGRDMGVAFD